MKPANILVFPDMTAKIGDFGMARTFSPRSRLAVSREICTLWYRAPELLMGSLTYDVKVDEWAVGCLTLEMLCGQNVMPGQIEDRSGRTCSCGQEAHLNHNLDQLILVFTLLGSPPHSFLQRYPCYEHFEDWEGSESALAPFLHQLGVFDRGDTVVRAPLEGASAECAEAIAHDWSKSACSERSWMEVLRGLLCIDPDKRATATQVLEMDLFRLANDHLSSREQALRNMRCRASGAHQPTHPAPLSYSHTDLSSLVPEQPSGLSNHPPLPVQRAFAYGSYGASGFQEGRRLRLRSSSQSRSPVRVASGSSR
ncbi:MAG: protein kinase domain-containing protein, partial [Promethearchaeia archaeon]